MFDFCRLWFFGRGRSARLFGRGQTVWYTRRHRSRVPQSSRKYTQTVGHQTRNAFHRVE